MKQSMMDFQGREKVPLVCFYILYIYLLIAPWHLMFAAVFL